MSDIKQQYRRGEIYMADLGRTKGSEQGGFRPVLIVQNDVGNRFAPTVVVLPMTSKMSKRPLPTHVGLDSNDYDNLIKNSIILAEQVATMDKSRLMQRLDTVNDNDMLEVETAMLVSLGFGTTYIINNQNNKNEIIKRKKRELQHV